MNFVYSNMELRELKYFIKAAELQNFTEASAQLFITQSTLSQQIKQLEEELGIPLFDRIAKRVYLTEAGKTFSPFAQKTVADAEAGKIMLNDLMNLNTGNLSVGLTYGLSHLLTNALLHFTAKYPKIHIQVCFGTTKELLTQLEDGKLDFILSFYEAKEKDNFSSDILFTSNLALIVGKQNPLYSRKKIQITDLPKIPIILPSNDYSIRNYMNEILESQDVSLNVQMEINDINMLLHIVEKGASATILMQTSLFNHPSLKAITLSGANLKRNGTITWKKEIYRKKAAKLLAELLSKV
ncbi:MAG: LysR family transcriptional regulator [Pseudopedobacter saltans]|uniref:LysR family transcriptional regulator n=1 Tax=Pseudopedobacter saltans TaxID=151895 RepID=A0A2W5E983_9SPHI|nr:MAG: LysR family transcriptional regulator [Pseudopedobacter saltans]